MKKVFICEICENVYEESKSAEYCEKQHRNFKDFIIKGVEYRNGNFSTYSEMAQARKVPDKIVIKLSDEQGDFGIYKLERYGMRGM